MKKLELYEIAKNFDYKTLKFNYKGLCPIFIKSDGTIESWVPGTDIEMATQQNNIIFIGNLSKTDALKGIKPDLGEFRELRQQFELVY